MTDLLAITGALIFGASAGYVVGHIKYRRKLRQYRKSVESACTDLNRSQRVSANYRIKALILCHNPETTCVFSHLFREVGVDIQECESESQAIDQLTSNKFEALVLDFDNFPGCKEVLRRVRRTRPNEAIQVFAVTSDDSCRTPAPGPADTFVVRQPVAAVQIRNLLRTVYGRMLRSSQEYFRLKIELTISIARTTGPLLQCTTINVSQNGIAVTTPVPFVPGELLHLVFVIPHSDVVVGGEGTVIWDDGHGKAGIRFACSSPTLQARFVEWLQGHFFMKFDACHISTEDARVPCMPTEIPRLGDEISVHGAPRASSKKREGYS